MSLRTRATSSVKWTASSSAIITVFQFLQLAILARLLVPEDFGLMAMILIVLGFAQSFADMGISNAIIYRQDTTKEQLSSLYWLNIFAGVAVFLIVTLATPLIVRLFNEPRLGDLIRWANLVFLIIPLGQQFQILMQKNLQFKQLALIKITAVAIGFGVAVTSAILGQGVYSLIWGQLANTSITASLLALVGWKRWRPGFHFHTKDLAGYLSFGIYQMGERSINYFNSRLDQIVIGALVGAQVLGYYNLAWNLAIQPVAKINPVLTNVAFPLFSRVQNDTERLKRGYFTLLKSLAFINFPLLLGLASIAPLFVPLALGSKWVPAVPLIQVLSFVALLRSTSNPIGSLLLAKGRADLGFWWNLMLMLTQIPGVYLGAHFGGAMGVALALLALQIVYSWFNYAVLVRRILGSCLRPYLLTMLPSLCFSGFMAITIILIPRLIQNHPITLLVFQIAAGLAVYFLLNWLLQRRQLIELKDMVIGARLA